MNKKGGAIVESVMVFPLVVFSLMALIYMMIYFYDQLENRVDMHIMLRAECGEVCDNMDYGDRGESAVPIYKKAQQLSSYDVISITGNEMLNAHSKSIEARKYLIDEVKFIRSINATGDALSDEE